MHIIEVIPFAKGAPGQGSNTLSYFTAKDIAPGTIVSIPLRGKSVLGLVAARREASAEKATLRASSFRLRKAGSSLGDSLFTPAFLATTEAVSRFYAARQGEVIAHAAPKLLFDKYKEWERPAIRRTKKSSGFKPEQFVYQREFSERVDTYKSMIRTDFARGASLFLLVPTVEEAERFAALLSRGIGSYSYVFHGDLSKKEMLARYNKLANDKHPVLIIGTPAFLFIPRDDIETIIVEHESSGAYRTRERPYLDFRVFVETLAMKAGKKLILADTLLQLETLYRHEQGDFLEFAPLKWRLSQSGSASLVDTREKEEKFSLIAEETAVAIKDALLRKKNVLVYAARRGFRPLTLCSDCGTTVTCERCESPLVLHGEKAGDRVFVCHKCKRERPADAPCANCGGWRLAMLGYGTEGVADELKKKFPDADVRVFDKDSVPAKGKARALADWFEEGKGRVLVGTELALHYLDGAIDTVIIASIDSLASIPSFRGNERILRTLLSLRLRSEKAFLVQTRLRDKSLLKKAQEGDLLNFYREEISQRLEFRYPPAVRLVKITIEGKKPTIDSEREAVEKLLAPYSPESFNAFISKMKGLYRSHIALRLPTADWPLPRDVSGKIDKRLEALLRSLPQAYEVRIDPDDLL